MVVNRREVPPFMVKVSYKTDGKSNRLYTFEKSEKDSPANQKCIYTWRDCTLRELKEEVQFRSGDEDIKVSWE